MKHALHKRMTVLALTLLFCVGAMPRALAAERIGDFRDLSPGAWYAQGVRYCVKNELMSGYGNVNHLFNPDGLMNRAELVTILWRMEGAPITGLAMHYDDVSEDEWYADAVRWAMIEGVMVGNTPMTFSPERVVTREQLALALWRYAEYRNGFAAEIDDPEYETYRDHDRVSEEAEKAMRWANAMGIITGTKDSDGSYVLTPWAQVSRAAAATILMRFCLDMGIYD